MHRVIFVLMFVLVLGLQIAQAAPLVVEVSDSQRKAAAWLAAQRGRAESDVLQATCQEALKRLETEARSIQTQQWQRHFDQLTPDEQDKAIKALPKR